MVPWSKTRVLEGKAGEGLVFNPGLLLPVGVCRPEGMVGLDVAGVVVEEGVEVAELVLRLLKTAETFLIPFIVKLQVVEVLLLQSPPQDTKAEPLVGLAVKVTLVPDIRLVWQVDPQLKPEPATVPLPVPDLVKVRL